MGGGSKSGFGPLAMEDLKARCKPVPVLPPTVVTGGQKDFPELKSDLDLGVSG